ncbi:MAG: TIGR04283 family arsenosugar biosynthesis glycosyltransferase [Pseudomonadota bacterium]
MAVRSTPEPVSQTPSHPRISLIVPTLNEATRIGTFLDCVQAMRERDVEVVLVDGGSSDDTCEQVKTRVDLLIQTAPGRGAQMRAGAARASGEILWFVHVDSQLPPNADQFVRQSINDRVIAWGYFNVRLHPTGWLLRCVEVAMNARVQLSNVATGDQGIFVTRTLYEKVGGMPDISLMEDVKLSKRLRDVVKPIRISESITTSSRRWRQHGVLRTIAKMWWLRFLYFIGVPPSRLARYYRPSP